MLYKYLFLKSKAWFVCKARTKDHIDYCKPIVVAVLMNRVAETPALRWIVKTIPETVWQKEELEVAIVSFPEQYFRAHH